MAEYIIVITLLCLTVGWRKHVACISINIIFTNRHAHSGPAIIVYHRFYYNLLADKHIRFRCFDVIKRKVGFCLKGQGITAS